jgi:hypothetical protein
MFFSILDLFGAVLDATENQSFKTDNFFASRSKTSIDKALPYLTDSLWKGLPFIVKKTYHRLNQNLFFLTAK